MISRNKYHTVVEWLLILKEMNYTIYTPINYYAMNPLSVFYIILLRNRLSVQPKRNKSLCRINYIRFYCTAWLSLISILHGGYPNDFKPK